MALTPGMRLGIYDVAALIGEGGMGQVFRATDPKLKRLGTPRAIRDLLRRCLNRDVKKRLRDMREARIAIEDALGDRRDPRRGGLRARAPPCRCRSHR